MKGYAVVDVETTGFSPAKHDRIIEIAVVQLSERGEVTNEWCTLVDPQRDPGPQRVHGIKASDLIGAPTFADIAGEVATLLQGRLLTAHNAQFDTLFLKAEFTRAGFSVPIDRGHALCTMRLAGNYLPAASRSLVACCAAAGIPLGQAHSALADAVAAAGLLQVYLAHQAPPVPWLSLANYATSVRWPTLGHSGRALIPKQRGSSDREPDGKWISRLVAVLPRVKEPPEADAYLDVLDRALLDRELSQTEKADLITLAEELGLDRPDILALHRDYLDALAVAAWADGVITPEERADMRAVAALLGLDADAVEQSLEATALTESPHAARPQFALEVGDRIVFTGEMVRSRDEWIRVIEAAGLETGAVTKNTKLLVAADTDSRSSKAKKARAYGVPTVGETAFTKLFSQYLRTQPPGFDRRAE